MDRAPAPETDAWTRIAVGGMPPGSPDPSDGEWRLSPSMAATPAYAELAGLVLGAEPLGVVLTRIAILTKEVLPAADDVSVTVLDRQKPRTMAFSGRRAAILDERQYQAGYGPCIDAAVTGGVIVIEDTATDELYPEFTLQASRAGIHQIMAIGLHAISPTTTGALNIYSSGEGFDPEVRELAVGFSAYIAVAVTNAAVFSGALMEVEQMHQALASRAVIEQAKGIVMAQLSCSAADAFAALRSRSNHDNRKLHDIARAIVDRVQPSPPSPH